MNTAFWRSESDIHEDICGFGGDCGAGRSTVLLQLASATISKAVMAALLMPALIQT